MIVPQQPIFRLPHGTDFFADEQDWYYPTSTTSLSASEAKQFMSHPQFYGLPQSSSFSNFDGSQQQYALGQQQTPREWASYSGNDHTHFSAQQARPAQQLNGPAHRRQPSNSSVFSHSSDSFAPATHMSQSYDQPRQFLSPWEAQQSPSSLNRHLPTPSHTPTQDSFPAAVRSQTQLARTSTINYELPVTPRTMNGDDFNDTQFQPPSRVVPKLDRTISDIYQDELYNPSFSQPAPQQQQQQQQQRQQQQNFNSAYLQPHQQHPNMVNERLQAANQARSASPAGVDKLRAVSPFRHGSPFAAGSAGYGQTTGHMQSAADTRRQQKAIADAMAMQQHRARPNDSQPTTISPKDAVLDYKQDPDDGAVPLFPQSQPSAQQAQTPSYAPHTANHQQQFSLPQTSFDFTQPTSHINQDSRYGPVSFQPMNSSQGSQAESHSLDFPAHLVSMETSKSEEIDEDDDVDHDDDDDDDSYDGSIQRPAKTTADTGTYTCTYHGCKERFESPARLQKHKREDHRSTGHGGPPPPSASPSAPTMTQAGPHRCDRINPQTGKPCNTVFSRPYDLTRHEDTIHNRQKTKVRCHLCTDEKTFSRSDALTRHMKVVHPTEPWPAKHKKRV